MMKKRTTFIVPLIMIGFSYFLYSYSPESKGDEITVTIEIPTDVQSVIDNKCITCHNTESDSQKSKMKLNFDKFINGKYTTSKLISKLGKINKQIEKGKMPTEKYLKKNPDKKLTAEESKLLMDWATDQRNILAGE